MRWNLEYGWVGLPLQPAELYWLCYTQNILQMWRQTKIHMQSHTQYLADHCSLGSHPGSLYTLIGSFPTKANEKLVSMDGLSNSGQPWGLTKTKMEYVFRRKELDWLGWTCLTDTWWEILCHMYWEDEIYTTIYKLLNKMKKHKTKLKIICKTNQ